MFADHTYKASGLKYMSKLKDNPGIISYIFMAMWTLEGQYLYYYIRANI